MHDLAVALLVSVRGSNLERPIPDLRAFLALQGTNKLKCPILNFLCSSYWILSSVLPSWERKPIAVIIIIIVWQRSLGRSLENQRPRRGAAVNAAGCGALRRRQCSRSPLYQPWHSFLSVPTHSYILCSTAGKLALVSFRCSFSSTFSRPSVATLTKDIIKRSRSEMSLMGKDTIENFS